MEEGTKQWMFSQIDHFQQKLRDASQQRRRIIRHMKLKAKEARKLSKNIKNYEDIILTLEKIVNQSDWEV